VVITDRKFDSVGAAARARGVFKEACDRMTINVCTKAGIAGNRRPQALWPGMLHTFCRIKKMSRSFNQDGQSGFRITTPPKGNDSQAAALENQGVR
jgi:hypothetical protein